MAFPKWITPAGNLGIVPELDYYQFTLDAYDENLYAFTGNIISGDATISDASNLDYLLLGHGVSGPGIPSGTVITKISPYGNIVSLSANATATTANVTVKANPIRYDRISGVLPEGIQIIPTGILQGIPISTPTVGSDKNFTYTFSIRATNVYTGNVSDRTFNLTVTNVAPPIIIPKNVINNIQLRLQGNITANIGDYLTQSISGANAQIITGVVSSSNVTVRYVKNSTSYIFGTGNLKIVSANVSLYPNVSVNAYPVSSTVVSSISNVDLGLFFDGAEVNLQLDAVEFANSAVLTWTVKTGDASLPPGLTLSSSGLLSGYIRPVAAVGPSSDPGWGNVPWDELGWDFPLGTTSKYFSFTIEVSDGVNFDVCTYNMLVYPRHYFTADSTLIKVDATSANTLKLSVDTGSRHYPIILSTQTDLPAERESGNFSFHISALDLDDDVLQYSVPSLSSGAFDEQYLSGNSITYITSTLVSGNLFTGVFPKTNVTTISTLYLFLGNSVTANVGQYITQPLSGANAQVVGNVTNSSTISIAVLGGNSFVTGQGNLYIGNVALKKSSFSSGSWANTSIVPASVITGAGISVDNTSAELIPGDSIQLLQRDPTIPNDAWYNGTVNSYANVRLTGNAVITASAGQWLTQAIGNANATIASVNSTIGTLYLSGNAKTGTLTIFGDVITANAGSYITQTSSGANAYISSNVFAAVLLPITYISGIFDIGSGNIKLNGTNVAAYPVAITNSLQPETFVANAGDIITQTVSGANATVIATQPGGTDVTVKFNSGVFTLGSGNLTLKGNITKMYPASVTTQTDITCRYNNSNLFKFNTTTANSFAYINGVNTYATPTLLNSIGVTLGTASTQGDIGFDEGKFDQGVLTLPTGLTIDTNSGWLTGTLPGQTVNEITYDFNILVYKKDYPGYTTNRQFTITVLGDLSNTINWLTPSNLGTIENGDNSDLFVRAISTRGKTLYYTYAADSSIRLPQGLELLSTGIITGRVSFEVFCLDHSQTTIDSNTTTFDNTYTFNVTAQDFDHTISATRAFTVKVLQRNIVPYENLYLKALLSRDQRTELTSILQDKTVFPLDLIYRNEDPYYGLVQDIKTLFLPGLNPSTLSHYANVVMTNHFTKKITFGDIKTAVAVDSSYDVIENGTGITVGTFQDGIGFIPVDFSLGYTPSVELPIGTHLDGEHIKYEVVYAEIKDDNTNSLGHGPAEATADAITLAGIIANPYYDSANVAYTTAYPNSFENMANVAINGPDAIGYINQGALPDWMTSKQPDGRVLGFTRAVVLAYTVPNASKTIAYRLQKSGYNLNELDFTVDRYQLDNNYTANYNIMANAYVVSKETTFDRYPGLSSVYVSAGVVDYAVTISYEAINGRSVTSINNDGGLDGIKSFQDGEQLVFFNQEFSTGSIISDTYNLGWSNVKSSWGAEPWDYDEGTVSTTDDLAWDAANYILGYNEHLLNPTVVNQRIGVWRINIDDNDRVTLSFVKTMNYYNKLYVRNGFTHGATNIYYDPLVKTNKTIPNYSIIPQQIKIIATIFDGNGTKFLSYRDSYSVPEQGDKYIKFAKNGVFT